jgi:flavin reductase (DIM6/NTAB) family NADH-FMN oxidoreductase RutF
MTNDSSTGTVASSFARLVAELDYPLYVVTTALHNEPTGCLVGFATQCSIHPPRFLAGISRKNHTFQLAKLAAVFAVHVVDERNKGIAELFGGETGDEVDKFSRVPWHYVDGVPILDDCARWFTGTVLEQINLGDHVGHVLEPLKVQTGSASDQLTYQQARDIEPGHKP